MAAATCGFALLSFVRSDMLFFWLSIVLRFIQGAADSCVVISNFSLVSIVFPEQQAKYMGYMEAALGIGLTAGPVLG